MYLDRITEERVPAIAVLEYLESGQFRDERQAAEALGIKRSDLQERLQILQLAGMAASTGRGKWVAIKK